jgi:hypothetical protein
MKKAWIASLVAVMCCCAAALTTGLLLPEHTPTADERFYSVGSASVPCIPPSKYISNLYYTISLRFCKGFFGKIFVQGVNIRQFLLQKGKCRVIIYNEIV